MTRKDFLYWQHEARLYLTKKYPEKFKPGLNTTNKSILHHINNNIEINNFEELITILDDLRKIFARYNVEILLRGQRKNYGFQYPSGMRISRRTRKEIWKLINNEKHEKWIGFMSNRVKWRINSNRRILHDPLYPSKSSISELPDYYPHNGNPIERKSWFHLIKRTIYFYRVFDFENSFQKSLIYLDSIFKADNPNLRIVEPVLQHYGWRTRWLDLVDDLEVASWFALYNPWEISHSILEGTEIKLNQYSYFYIYAIHTPNSYDDGLSEGEDQKLVNLGSALGQVGKRPKRQKAYALIDKKLEQENDIIRIDKIGNYDYSKFVLCQIKIKADFVYQWLKKQGNDFESIRKFNYLFPHFSTDILYKNLLDYQAEIDELSKSTKTRFQYFSKYMGRITNYHLVNSEDK